MTFDFTQISAQIQDVSMDIQRKVQKLTYLNQDQITILDVIKSQPHADHTILLEQQKKEAQFISELQIDIQLLRWKQKVLEDANGIKQELNDLKERSKTAPAFAVTFTDQSGTVQTIESTMRIDQLEAKLQELDDEYSDAERHWNFEQEKRKPQEVNE